MNNNCLVEVERIPSDKKRDGLITLNLWIYVICAFIILCIQTFCEARINVQKEASWKCTACQQRVWVKNPDWRGDYYCPSCGTKKP